MQLNLFITAFVCDVNLPVTLYFLRSRWHLLHAFQIAYRLYLKIFSPFRIFEQLVLSLKHKVNPKIFHCVDDTFFVIQDF